MRPDLPTLLSALADVARPAMLREWRRDSCIAAAAITVEALRIYGYAGTVLAVEARVMNRPMADWSRAGGEGRPPAEAHEVALGMVTTEAAGFGGLTAGRELHLAVWAEPWLFDLSLDQAARPKHGMPVEATAFSVPPDDRARMLAGEPVGWAGPEGMLYVYRVRPGVTWWRTSPNFGRRDASRRERVVGAVVRYLRDRGYSREY